MFDEALEPISDGVPEPAGTPPSEPANADGAESQPAVLEEAAQPHEARETDAEFGKQNVFADPKAWEGFTNKLAEVTGRELSEVQALPFAERMALLDDLKDAPTLRQKLESLADFEDFTGIVVNAPADKWDVSAQLNALPDNHFGKLVDTVMSEQLPTFVESVMTNPQAHPQEYQLLDNAFTALLEKVTGRQSDEITSILQMTAGVTPQRLAQILQGQAGGAPATGATGASQSYSGQLVSQAQAIYAQAQQLVNEGWEENSLQVQQLVTSAQSVYHLAQQAQVQEQQAAAMQSKLSGLESRLNTRERSEKEQARSVSAGKVDGLATTARSGVLEAVIKGRIPEGDTDTAELIELKAGELLKANVKAQSYLDLARDYMADGLEAKAKSQLALYTQQADRAYKEAAAKILPKLVAQTNALRQTDQQKAARKEIGANTGAPSTFSREPDKFENVRIGRDDNAGDVAVQMYRQRREATV